MPLDLSPCRLGSLTSLGHCAYRLRHCPQCAGAYAVCTVCPEACTVCPGCRHRAVLAQIAAGEVVFPALPGDYGEPHDTTAVGDLRPDLDDDQAGELAHGAQAVNDPRRTLPGISDQAVTLDATPIALYNHGIVESPHISDSSTALGAGAMASPVFVLVIPLVSQDLGHVLQALAPVLAGNGATNGHLPAVPAGPPELPRFPRKTYLSDTQCPSGHTYQDTGKVLRFRGNNQCVPCSGQRRPRRTAASTTATTEG